MRLLSPQLLQVPLRPRWRSALLLGLAGVLAVSGSVEVGKRVAAATLANSADIARVRSGLAWNGGAAEVWERLSRLDTAGWEPGSRVEAVAAARRAVELNPRQTDYWLQLASACESLPDPAGAQQALERATALSPMRPQVWWAAANYYLRAGKGEEALSCLRCLLALDPKYAAPIFDLALRAFGHPETLLAQITGENPDQERLLAFVDCMSGQGRFPEAHQAWTRLESQATPVPFGAARNYLECLLNQGRVEEAAAVWRRLRQWGAIPREEGGAAGSVYNGGFEETPLQAGFDWRSVVCPFVSVDFADSQAYQGRRCLRVDFLGQNEAFEPVYQILPVAPQQAYTLSAWVRAQDLTSDSGPRLRVVDLACPSCLDASTEATVGSTPWRQVNLKFLAGPQTRAVRLSLWRPRSRSFPMEISGAFWVDEVKLQVADAVDHP